jgi:hypothetical protein
MIRLVQQFDAPRTRIQAASAKSHGCSCCCCCCVLSTLGVGVLTARSIPKTRPGTPADYTGAYWQHPAAHGAPAVQPYPAAPAMTPMAGPQQPGAAQAPVMPAAPPPNFYAASEAGGAFIAPGEVPVENRRGWQVLAFFLLPMSFMTTGIGFAAFKSYEEYALLLGFATYLGGLWILNNKTGIKKRMLFLLIVLFPIASVAEVFLWLAALSML